MIVSTTSQLQNRDIATYHGVVTGEAIVGANIFRDMFAGIRNIVGGRAGGYEKALRGAREAAMEEMMEAAREMGGDAVIGVDIDYETITAGEKGSMLMVSVSGTAVTLR